MLVIHLKYSFRIVLHHSEFKTKNIPVIFFVNFKPTHKIMVSLEITYIYIINKTRSFYVRCLFHTNYLTDFDNLKLMIQRNYEW